MRDFSDPVAEKRLMEVAHSSGFSNWLGFELVAAGNGQTELSLAVRPEMRQHHGYVHGGVVATLADVASAWAAATIAGDVVTGSINLHFLAPALGDRLVVRAAVLKSGKRQASVEAKVHAVSANGAEKLCGASMASIAILSAGTT